MNWKHNDDKFDIQFNGYLKLIEAIILRVYDQISISGKWKNKNISIKTLLDKQTTLKEMNRWFKDWRWQVWLDVYSEFSGHDKRAIRKNFIKIRKKSVKEVNKRLKEFRK